MLLKVGSDHGLKSGKPLDSAGGSALCSVMTRGLGWEGRQAPEGGGVCGQRADSRASLAVLLGKNSPAVQEVLGVTPRSGRFPRRRAWQPTPCSCIWMEGDRRRIPIDRGMEPGGPYSHGVAKSQTQLSN